MRPSLTSAFSHSLKTSLMQVQGSWREGYLPKPFPLFERKRDSVGKEFILCRVADKLLLLFFFFFFFFFFFGQVPSQPMKTKRLNGI